MFVGYGFAAEESAELARRTRVALEAYGADFDVPAILEREYTLAEERCLRNGWQRQLAKLPIERAWLAANRALLESERFRSRSDRRPSLPTAADTVLPPMYV